MSSRGDDGGHEPHPGDPWSPGWDPDAEPEEVEATDVIAGSGEAVEVESPQADEELPAESLGSDGPEIGDDAGAAPSDDASTIDDVDGGVDGDSVGDEPLDDAFDATAPPGWAVPTAEEQAAADAFDAVLAREAMAEADRSDDEDETTPAWTIDRPLADDAGELGLPVEEPPWTGALTGASTTAEASGFDPVEVDQPPDTPELAEAVDDGAIPDLDLVPELPSEVEEGEDAQSVLEEIAAGLTAELAADEPTSGEVDTSDVAEVVVSDGVDASELAEVGASDEFDAFEVSPTEDLVVEPGIDISGVDTGATSPLFADTIDDVLDSADLTEMKEPDESGAPVESVDDLDTLAAEALASLGDDLDIPLEVDDQDVPDPVDATAVAGSDDELLAASLGDVDVEDSGGMASEEFPQTHDALEESDDTLSEPFAAVAPDVEEEAAAVEGEPVVGDADDLDSSDDQLTAAAESFDESTEFGVASSEAFDALADDTADDLAEWEAFADGETAAAVETPPSAPESLDEPLADDLVAETDVAEKPKRGWFGRRPKVEVTTDEAVVGLEADEMVAGVDADLGEVVVEANVGLDDLISAGPPLAASAEPHVDADAQPDEVGAAVGGEFDSSPLDESSEGIGVHDQVTEELPEPMLEPAQDEPHAVAEVSTEEFDSGHIAQDEAADAFFEQEGPKPKRGWFARRRQRKEAAELAASAAAVPSYVETPDPVVEGAYADVDAIDEGIEYEGEVARPDGWEAEFDEDELTPDLGELPETDWDPLGEPFDADAFVAEVSELATTTPPDLADIGNSPTLVDASDVTQLYEPLEEPSTGSSPSDAARDDASTDWARESGADDGQEPLVASAGPDWVGDPSWIGESDTQSTDPDDVSDAWAGPELVVSDAASERSPDEGWDEEDDLVADAFGEKASDDWESPDHAPAPVVDGGLASELSLVNDSDQTLDEGDEWVTGPIDVLPSPAADLDDMSYAESVTTEHRGLAEDVLRSGAEDTELQALSAAMPGLETGVVGFDDVADLGSDEVVTAPARSDLGVRMLTGVILAGLLLGSLWSGGEALAIFVGLMVLVGLGEFYTTLNRRGFQPLAVFGYAGGIGMMVGTWFYGLVSVPVAVLLVTVAVFFFYAFAPMRRDALTNGGLTILGMVWTTGAGAFAIEIFGAADVRPLVIAVAAVTVAMDVGAYGFGRAFGSAPLAPILSPNKSIEGLAGGTVFAIGVAVLIGAVVTPFDIQTGAALGLVVAIAAPLGDLAESMIKRSLGVKDMGVILPGHGGILDRIDAFLFVLPAAWALYESLGLLL